MALIVHRRDLLRDSEEHQRFYVNILVPRVPTTTTNGREVVMLNPWNESQ